MNKHRIGLLDSFRCISIILVMLFHYSTPPVKQILANGQHMPAVTFGYLGVEFFYIISGFVISYSLENTPDISTFFQHRFIRLFPAMLFCSLVTLIIAILFDNTFFISNAHDVKNLLPGLTFINPSIWKAATGVDFHWIDGSYWSLWAEMQFYIIVSLIYFGSRKHFLRNMLIAAIVICIQKNAPMDFPAHFPGLTAKYHLAAFFEGWRYGNEMFNISYFIFWFTFGIIFYQLYKGYLFKKQPVILIGCFWVLVLFVLDVRRYFNPVSVSMFIGCGVMFIVFTLLIYKSQYLRFLDNRFIRRIGVTSYSIYLLHEVTGIILMKRFGYLLGPFGWVAPYIMIIIMIGLGELIFKYIEQRINIKLRTPAETKLLAKPSVP
jgi:peptidoglycan/LPS O-acetylase OafA/YrhL